MEKSKEIKNEEFFNNFSIGEEVLDLNKSREELLKDMYVDMPDEAAALSSEAVLNLKNFSPAEFIEEKVEKTAHKILSTWFGREVIFKRLFDVFKYSTLSFLVFGGIFVATNYESFMQRASYAIENGKDSIPLYTFVADISAKISNFKDEKIAEINEKKSQAALVMAAKDQLKNSPGVKEGVMPELGYSDAPSVLEVNNIAFDAAPTESRIIIPKIKVNAPISWSEGPDEKSMLSALEKGVAYFPGSALPGQYGNVFLTGHSSFYAWSPGKYKSVFALLDKLQNDDEITIWYNQKKFVYKIFDHFIVSPDNLDVLDQAHGEKLLSLMTCTPVGTNKNRLIYRARLLEDKNG